MESIRNPLPKPPKYMDADYRTLPDIESNPLFYDEDAQEILCYWTDGKMVYWRYSPVSNDVEHFVWFNNHFAKDSKHCFLQRKKLRNVDHASFTALNNCYARDCKSVWTTGGRFEPEDISSFVFVMMESTWWKWSGPCPMVHSAPSECGFPTDMPRTARPCTMKTLPVKSRY